MSRASAGLLLGVVLFTGCHKGAAHAAPPAADTIAPEPAQVEGLSIQQVRASLDRWYRVAPDRRLVWAYSELENVLTGREVPRAVAVATAGRWRVRIGEQSAGELPDDPTFVGALDALSARAKPLLAAAGVRGGATPVPGFMTFDEAVKAGAAAGEQWKHGERTAATLGQAAAAATSLLFQHRDAVGVSDEVFARALALVAAARAAGATGWEEPAALMAEWTGYVSDAESLARQLPKHSAVRALLLSDDAELRPLTERRDAPDAIRLLWFVRRIWSGYREGNSAEAERLGLGQSSPLAVAVLLTRVDDFVAQRDAGRGLWMEVMNETARLGAVPGPRAAEGGLTDQLEAALASPALDGGPLLGRQLLPAVLRADGYSALWSKLKFELDLHSDLQAARSFRARLGQPLEPRGRQFATAVELLLDARDRDVGAAADGWIRESASFGLVPVIELYQAVKDRAGVRSPRDMALNHHVFARADSRPTHIDDLQARAYYALQALPMAEALSQRQCTVMGNEGQCRWLESYRGGWERVEAVARGDHNAPDQRTAAIQSLLWAHRLDEAEGKKLLLAIAAEHPDSGAAVLPAADFLQAHKDVPGAIALLRSYADKERGNGGLDAISVRVRIGRMLLERGDPSAAWKELEPLVVSQKGDAMREGAVTLASLHRIDEARELASFAAERYPGDDTLLGKAEVEWAAGNMDAAAALVAELAKGDHAQSWSLLKVYAERAFSLMTPDQAKAAVDALLKHRLPFWMMQSVGDALRDRAMHELAFELYSRAEGGPMDTASAKLWAAERVVATKGRAAAVAYLQRETKSIPPDLVGLALYQNGESELLWEVFPPDETRNDGIGLQLWNLRAYAAMTNPVLRAQKLPVLQAHFAAASPVRLSVLGRAVVGVGSEDELYRWAHGHSDRLSDAAAALGLRALAEGREEDASDDFRLATEMGVENEFGDTEARRRLCQFQDAGRKLKPAAR